MLADTDTGCPRSVTGRRTPSSSRSTSRARSSSSPRSSHTTTNSSPPSRATVSPDRSAPRMPLATETSTSSPASCPKRVVDLLEAVEVDEQHRDPGRRAVRAEQRGLQPVAQQPPVRQVGEAVVQRGVQQHPLGVAPAGRVVEADQRRAVAGLGQLDGRHDGPQVVAAGVPQPALGGAQPQPADVVRRDVVVQPAADQRDRRVPEVVAQRLVDLDDQAGPVDHRHRHRAALEHRPEVGRPGRRVGGMPKSAAALAGPGVTSSLRQHSSPLADPYPPVTERVGKRDSRAVTPTARESRKGQVRSLSVTLAPHGTRRSSPRRSRSRTRSACRWSPRASRAAAQLAVLRNQGCNQVQGYLLARPMPAEQVRRIFTGHARVPAIAPVVLQPTP